MGQAALYGRHACRPRRHGGGNCLLPTATAAAPQGGGPPLNPEPHPLNPSSATNYPYTNPLSVLVLERAAGYSISLMP
jgi:hypothetical protein